MERSGNTPLLPFKERVNGMPGPTLFRLVGMNWTTLGAIYLPGQSKPIALTLEDRFSHFKKVPGFETSTQGLMNAMCIPDGPYFLNKVAGQSRSKLIQKLIDETGYVIGVSTPGLSDTVTSPGKPVESVSFTGIRMHPVSTHADTAGCIGVAESVNIGSDALELGVATEPVFGPGDSRLLSLPIEAKADFMSPRTYGAFADQLMASYDVYRSFWISSLYCHLTAGQMAKMSYLLPYYELGDSVAIV
jgi:hypothetical protein